MAIIRLDCNLNGGDSVTPNNELFYRIYGDVDNYAAPIWTTGTALSDANVTVDNDRVIITGVDGTTNTLFKISSVDLSGNEGALSDAYSLTQYYSISTSFDSRTYATIVPEQLFSNEGDYFAIRTQPDASEANGILGSSAYPETAFTMSLVNYFTHYDDAQASTVCSGSNKLSISSMSTLKVETLSPDTECEISGNGNSEQFTVVGNLNKGGYVFCTKPTLALADSNRSYWLNATTEYLDFNGDKVYFKNNTGTHVSESGNITVQLISKGGVVPDLSVLYTELAGKPLD